MTEKEALKLARKAANNYANANIYGSYTSHEWDEPWMSDWYGQSPGGSLAYLARKGRPEEYKQTVFRLAQEILKRNSDLYKAMQEND